MRAALRVLAFLGSVAAFTVIAGGQWGTLQTVAWARMIVTYTQDSGSLRQGLADTFDGAHPCELCRRIQTGIEKEGRDERQKPAGQILPGKTYLVAVLPTAFFAPLTREGGPLPALAAVTGGRAAEAPPVPPPRRVGV